MLWHIIFGVNILCVTVFMPSCSHKEYKYHSLTLTIIIMYQQSDLKCDCQLCFTSNKTKSNHNFTPFQRIKLHSISVQYSVRVLHNYCDRKINKL